MARPARLVEPELSDPVPVQRSMAVDAGRLGDDSCLSQPDLSGPIAQEYALVMD